MVHLMPAADVERILRDMRELLLMDEQAHIDSEALMLEVTRYLAAVDVFRAESCEPMWLPELVDSSRR